MLKLNELKQIITDKICANDNCFYKNDNYGLEIKCILSVTNLEESIKKFLIILLKLL